MKRGRMRYLTVGAVAVAVAVGSLLSSSALGVKQMSEVAIQELQVCQDGIRFWLTDVVDPALANDPSVQREYVAYSPAPDIDPDTDELVPPLNVVATAFVTLPRRTFDYDITDGQVHHYVGTFVAPWTLNAGDTVRFEITNTEQHNDVYTVQNCLLGEAVGIDIRPGSASNLVNPRSRAPIPVAVLTTTDFDATTVDTSTVRFGLFGTEAPVVRSSRTDVDRDGDTDLLLSFKTNAAAFTCLAPSATVTGATSGGDRFSGTDIVNVAGCSE